MTTKRDHRYTLEEYLALERESEVKYEFWDGEIFAMSGGTLAHDQIMGKRIRRVASQITGRGLPPVHEQYANQGSSRPSLSLR